VTPPLRVLLSAFACDPVFGSDEEVGWQWARQLALHGHDVHVLTRRSHRQEIERAVAGMPEMARVTFHYVDLDRLHGVLKRVNRRNHLYYYFWQWQAYRRARALHAAAPFDLVHHVTWVSFRQPSFMGRLGIPFYFGPVAGGDEIPAGYARNFAAKQKVVEVVRGIANRLVRYDPLMRMTFGQAERLFVTSAGHLPRLPASAAAKARVELAIGMDALAQLPAVARGPGGQRLLFAGRCIGWKGMDLGLQIFARMRSRAPGVTLTIVGDGADRARWMRSAETLGVADAIDWRGWLTKDAVQHMYAEFDMLFYPSLRDSGGFVVMEALSAGLPVACFKLGGPGVVVDDSCGVAVEATLDIEATVDRYAAAALALLERTHAEPGLAQACRDRVQHFTWRALIERIYGGLPNKPGAA
jgi:glycosyltransferase involved in cell wall biosynthesis